MGRSTDQGFLRSAGLGLLAVAIGASVSPAAYAASVGCRITASGASNIVEKDGYAQAVLNLAAFSCGEKRTVAEKDRSVATVAVAMAEAVATVEATCSGSGSRAKLSGKASVRAKAKAVGRATASIIAKANVCKLCNGALRAVTDLMRTVSVEAVATASVKATFKFKPGKPRSVTIRDRKVAVEKKVLDVLARSTAVIRADSVEGCTGEGKPRVKVGKKYAECDVEVVADALETEIDAVAEQAVSVQALACAGNANKKRVNQTVREVAVAVARAISSAQVVCSRSAGPGIVACGSVSAFVKAVARSTARAFAKGLATVTGVNCVCDLASEVSVGEIQKVVARSASEASAEACADGKAFALDSDFQQGIQERLAVAIAQVVLSAVGGKTCAASSASPFVCAQAGVCVESRRVCSSMDGINPCCAGRDVCARLPGRNEFKCVQRTTAKRKRGTEIIECE